eukprot:g5005.t1
MASENIDLSPKAKSKPLRTYDVEGFRRRSGCIVLRPRREIGSDDDISAWRQLLPERDQVEVLVIGSRRHKGKSILPAGGVDPGEDERTAAVRETIEEAGVRGLIVDDLGIFQNDEKRHRTRMFVMLFQEDVAENEWEERDRGKKWIPLETMNADLKPSQQVYTQSVLACVSKVPRESP